MSATIFQARTPGHPTKFNAPTLRRFLKCVARGMPMGLSAAAAGVSTASISNWKRQFPRFEQLVARAVARGVSARLRRIEEASKTDWHAAAWLLSNTNGEYLSRNRVELTGADGAPLSAGVTLYLPAKQDGNGGPLPAVTVPALAERNDGNNNNERQ